MLNEKLVRHMIIPHALPYEVSVYMYIYWYWLIDYMKFQAYTWHTSIGYEQTLNKLHA